MIFSVAKSLFYIIILLILLTVNLIAQISWKGSVEAGSFSSSINNINNKHDLLYRLEGQAGYKYANNNNLAKLNIKLNPEFYGINADISTLKFSLDGLYVQQGKFFDWGLNFAATKNNFFSDNLDISFETFLLNGEISWYVQSQLLIQTNAGLAYRNMDMRNSTTLDIQYVLNNFTYLINSYFRIAIGFYLEKFNIANRYKTIYQNTQKNSGWRVGPQLNLHYLKSIILNLEYKFLFHDSEITVYPSYDQSLRLMVGKTLISKLTAFVLVDFYIRDFEFKDNENYLDLTYNPINSENSVYLKIGYDIRKNFEFYLKTGYFDENLFYNDYSFSGWNLLLGIELHK